MTVNAFLKSKDLLVKTWQLWVVCITSMTCRFLILRVKTQWVTILLETLHFSICLCLNAVAVNTDGCLGFLSLEPLYMLKGTPNALSFYFIYVLCMFSIKGRHEDLKYCIVGTYPVKLLRLVYI